MGILGLPKPGVDVSDADAAVGEVKDGKFFYSVEAPRKEGTMPTVAVAPGSSAYPAGYHAGNVGGLVAIDEHLVAGQIKKDTVIFGVTGTFLNTLGGDAFVNADKFANLTSSWVTKQTTNNIPAAATRVAIVLMNDSEATVGDYCRSQALYNGVQRLEIWTIEAKEWIGEGVGSAVPVIVQCKERNSDDKGEVGVAVHYIT